MKPDLQISPLQYHTAVGKVWVEMARNLADSLILPFNLTDYADILSDLSTTLLGNFGDLMRSKGIEIDTGNLDIFISEIPVVVYSKWHKVINVFKKSKTVLHLC